MTTYTYSYTDPLRKAESGTFTRADMTMRPAEYWAEALVIYWWDQVSVNLTKANHDNFNMTLESVLLQGTSSEAENLKIALYTNTSQDDIDSLSTITTSILLSNTTSRTTLQRPPSESFSTDNALLLKQLGLSEALNLFTILYWAIDLDLGQQHPQNIFLNASLLDPETLVFHNNSFIVQTFQNTPLADGFIPGNNYGAIPNQPVPLTHKNAVIITDYQCWKWSRKPGFKALIDVLVPSIVLFLLIFYPIYLLVLFCLTKPNGKLNFWHI